ncbi:hypothetical protein TNIN_224711 [Trichonephila inaurata madagascariensis]|uniref:Uncharacterized protein n=1 Tax=Trichonephila inaurata madagascariensis TaxID=2747483 RepID=A0A8X6YC95_9ARAC|nr:hypothetical protein TNIN_224711 [Trichonephila inaurata madagascariensis]
MTFLQIGDEDIRRERRGGAEAVSAAVVHPQGVQSRLLSPSRCVGAGECSFSGHLSLPHPSARLWNTAAKCQGHFDKEGAVEKDDSNRILETQFTFFESPTAPLPSAARGRSLLLSFREGSHVSFLKPPIVLTLI